ncbi:MAG: CRTAC1 family protein [Actinomycetota bacterium]|nr:CRTAC1 family protein [Actinomycetota bacterium]
MSGAARAATSAGVAPSASATNLVDVSGSLSGFHRPIGGPDNAGGLAGAAWFDYNNSGRLSLFIPGTPGHPNALFENLGGGRFVNVAAQAGVAGGQGGGGVAVADISNDGCEDLLVSGTGGIETGHQSPTKLYLNNGNNTFTDVAAQSGLASALGFWMSVTLGDIYNHGNLDLFSTNAGHSPGGLPFEDLQPLQVYFPHGLWENTSNPLAALTSPFVSGTVGLTPDPTGGLLSPLGSPLPGALGAATSGLADALAPALKPVGAALGGVFYKNVSQAAGLSNLNWGWGASFADFANDGHEDLFFNGTYPGLGGLIHSAPFIGDQYGNPGYLLHNDGTGEFTIAQTFAQQNRFTSGSAVGDYNNDGRPDIAIVNTAHGSDPGAPILLENKTVNNNGWITVKLVGTKSNRDGIGAKVWVLDGPLTKLQEVRSGTGFASQDSLWLTFGVGPNAPATVPVEVAWPSGLLETFNASTDRKVTLTEGTGRPTSG